MRKNDFPQLALQQAIIASNVIVAKLFEVTLWQILYSSDSTVQSVFRQCAPFWVFCVKHPFNLGFKRASFVVLRQSEAFFRKKRKVFSVWRVAKHSNNVRQGTLAAPF